MKIFSSIRSGNSSSSTSQLLLFAFWAAVAAGPAGAFVAPASQQAIGAGRISGGLALRASTSDASAGKRSGRKTGGCCPLLVRPPLAAAAGLIRLVATLYTCLGKAGLSTLFSKRSSSSRILIILPPRKHAVSSTHLPPRLSWIGR